MRIECVLCLRNDRMKHTVKSEVQEFLGLDDVYVRRSEDYIRLAEVVRSGKRNLKWLCQWCHNLIESFFIGRRARAKQWGAPLGCSSDGEWLELFCVAALANRLRIEAGLWAR